MKFTMLLCAALLFIGESMASGKKYRPRGAFDYTSLHNNMDDETDDGLDGPDDGAGSDEDIPIEDLLSATLLGQSKIIQQYCTENSIRAKRMMKKNNLFSRKGKGIKRELRSYINRVEEIINHLHEMSSQISHAQSSADYRSIVNYMMNSFNKCKAINNIGISKKRRSMRKSKRRNTM